MHILDVYKQSLIYQGLTPYQNAKGVRYPCVSPGPTLSRNEKVKQHIRKKTYKPKALKFWVEGGVILLCWFGSCLILIRLPGVSLLKFFQQVVTEAIVWAATDLDE